MIRRAFAWGYWNRKGVGLGFALALAGGAATTAVVTAGGGGLGLFGATAAADGALRTIFDLCVIFLAILGI